MKVSVSLIKEPHSEKKAFFLVSEFLMGETRAPDKRGTEDNSKIYFSMKTYVVAPH